MNELHTADRASSGLSRFDLLRMHRAHVTWSILARRAAAHFLSPSHLIDRLEAHAAHGALAGLVRKLPTLLHRTGVLSIRRNRRSVSRSLGLRTFQLAGADG